MDPAVKAAIAAIPAEDWTGINYRAVWDGQLLRAVRDARGRGYTELVEFASA